MKTELIYSRNHYEDIRLAIDEIQAFRQAYLPLTDPNPGNSAGIFSMLMNRLRLLVFPMRFRGLQETDDTLKALCDKLTQLAELVQISDLMQTTYARYNGKMDVRVKSSGKHKYKLIVSTGGYSDDIGNSGSVRIPPIKREFMLDEDSVDRVFSRGVIDFSWIDGELNGLCCEIRSLQSRIASSHMPLTYSPAPPALPVFDDSGESPRDILE